MPTDDGQVALDDLISQYYGEIASGDNNRLQQGCLCWTHISYAQEHLELWRPTGTDESRTTVNAFSIKSAPNDAFNRALPLYIPPLESNEEFVVLRAKRRPVLVIAPVPSDPGIRGLRQGGRIHRPVCLVAPIFSLVDPVTEKLKYRPEFVSRIRRMTYPEFFYLPAQGMIRRPSYIRLCEIQAVYEPHLEQHNQGLHPEVIEILQGQIRFLLTGQYSGDYQLYREELLNAGPSDS